VARIAKAQGCEVTAVVTRPLPFEGKRRAQQASHGQKALKAYVPRIVVVKLCELMPQPPGTRIIDVYKMADRKAARAVMDTLQVSGVLSFKLP
jgi:cell division protein FtsZ